MAIAVTHRRFTVHEYHRMAEAGIIGEDERVELIEGEIVAMAPIGRRHVSCVARLTHLFARGVGDRAVVLVQSPIRLTDDAEPQPDLAILHPREDFYNQEAAGPHDALLIIEVADTSARYDRQVKVPLYAQAGIPEVWLVDLTTDGVTIYREPEPEGYAQVRLATGSDALSPLAFPEFVLTVDRVLG
jgi:Uma2 family endonuclease